MEHTLTRQCTLGHPGCAGLKPAPKCTHMLRIRRCSPTLANAHELTMARSNATLCQPLGFASLRAAPRSEGVARAPYALGRGSCLPESDTGQSRESITTAFNIPVRFVFGSRSTGSDVHIQGNMMIFFSLGYAVPGTNSLHILTARCTPLVFGPGAGQAWRARGGTRDAPIAPFGSGMFSHLSCCASISP